MEEAMKTILSHTSVLPTCEVSIDDANGRYLAEAITAGEPLPPFRASVKDGYAVVAEDGPGVYPLIGSVTAGAIPSFKVVPRQPLLVFLSYFQVEKGTLAYITTGSALPDGADAVVMIEDTVLLPKGIVNVLYLCPKF